jgi:hypothetical protein
MARETLVKKPADNRNFEREVGVEGRISPAFVPGNELVCRITGARLPGWPEA